MEMSEVKKKLRIMSVTITSTTVGTRTMCRLETYYTLMNSIWIS